MDLRRTVLSWLLAALLLMMICSGCGSEVGAISLPPEIGGAPPDETERMTVDVYWDATYSMQGYTRLSAGNAYRTLPDNLGDIATSLGEVHFYRFGAEIQPVEGREYRRFSTPEYHDELITSVGNVVGSADPQHLSVIVTDLFESDADWSNVTQQLKEKYFSKHLAVAVIGIKNSFMGDIFDVGLNAAKYRYNSGDDPAKYRPFYLFLMGPENQIGEFLEKWRSHQSGHAEMQYVVFSEHFAPQAEKIDFSQAEMENIFEDDRLEKADRRLMEIGIADMSEPARLKIVVDCRPAFAACPIDSGKMHLISRVFAMNEDVTWDVIGDENSIPMSFSKHEGDENAYDIELQIQPEQVLRPGSINVLQVQVVPTARSVALPSWVEQWNMPDIDISPEAFDGSKTVNLQHVMASLKDSMLISSHPALAEMYLLIDAR